VFSFGYHGWGRSTGELIRSVDAIEQGRGFAPPLWVDVRLHRAVIAEGFRGEAFATRLGPRRYVWLPGLGNRAVGEPGLGRVRLADPAQARPLLHLARGVAERRQRLIVFCHCFIAAECHRAVVARRLLREAAAARVAVEVVEWPGGEPETFEVGWGRSVAGLDQRTRLPVSPAAAARFWALPWGSILRLRRGRACTPVIAGPARRDRRGWALPLFPDHIGGEGLADWVQAATRIRQRYGWAGRGVRPAHPAQQVTPQAVYTVVHPDRLTAIAPGGSGTFRAGQRWVAAAELLRAARQRAGQVPLIFGDATACQRLLGWAILHRLRYDATGTTYRVEHVRRSPRARVREGLLLASANRPIASTFIRPYALCWTPAFVVPVALRRLRSNRGHRP
jgi:hypothetical protein